MKTEDTEKIMNKKKIWRNRIHAHIRWQIDRIKWTQGKREHGEQEEDKRIRRGENEVDDGGEKLDILKRSTTYILKIRGKETEQR